MRVSRIGFLFRVGPMSPNTSKADRRYQRIPTPKGVWVAWHDGKQQNVSRVRDLNRGGLFIVTPDALPLGAIVTILLSVPEGEIRSGAIVGNTIPKEGIGIEFTNMNQVDVVRLATLIARLMPASAGTPYYVFIETYGDACRVRGNSDFRHFARRERKRKEPYMPAHLGLIVRGPLRKASGLPPVWQLRTS